MMKEGTWEPGRCLAFGLACAACHAHYILTRAGCYGQGQTSELGPLPACGSRPCWLWAEHPADTRPSFRQLGSKHPRAGSKNNRLQTAQDVPHMSKGGL